MIGDLKPYPSMKDSGVEWLGTIPKHWEALPLCAVATLKSCTGRQHRELLSVYLDKGVIPFSEVAEKRTNVTSEDLSNYQAVDPGDFVLNNQQAWRGSVGVSGLSGIVSPAYLVLWLFRVFSGWPTGSRLLHPADPTSPAVTSEPKRRPRNPQIPYTPVRSWATRKGNKTLINRELSL